MRQGPAPGLGQERVPQWPQQPQQPPLGSGLEPGIARDHRAHWLDGRLDAAVGKHNLYDPSQLGGSNLLFDLKIGQEHAKENRPGMSAGLLPVSDGCTTGPLQCRQHTGRLAGAASRDAAYAKGL